MAGKGNPKGVGRPKGAKGKVGQDVRELARKYTSEAVTTLAQIMAEGESDQARAMAADKLLDRGWGRPSQAITGEDGGPVQHAIRLAWLTEAEAKARGLV